MYRQKKIGAKKNLTEWEKSKKNLMNEEFLKNDDSKMDEEKEV